MKSFSLEKPQQKEEVNTLKSEHLKEGVSPIIACIGTPEHFKEQSPEGDENSERPEYEVIPNPAKDTNNNRNVDYYGRPEELSRQDFKNAGRYSYVISPVDNLDKFSESFMNCTGLVVAGIDKETGESISFLSHQDPGYFLTFSSATEKFADDLRERIQELKDRCEDGTIDAVIVGGNYFSDRTRYREDYLMSIAVVSKEVKGVLGFEPVVITGPKTVSGQDDVFFDNTRRRLYIMRPKVARESTRSYLPSDIINQTPKWDKEPHKEKESY